MINRQWHETHPLSKKASLDERVQWHLEHTEACGCRDMPESIKRELERRGIEPPTRRS